MNALKIVEVFALVIMMSFTSAVVGAFILFGDSFYFAEPNATIRVIEVILGLFSICMGVLMIRKIIQQP